MTRTCSRGSISRIGLARDAGSLDGESETDAVLGRIGWTIRFGEYAFMTWAVSERCNMNLYQEGHTGAADLSHTT